MNTSTRTRRLRAVRFRFSRRRTLQGRTLQGRALPLLLLALLSAGAAASARPVAAAPLGKAAAAFDDARPGKAETAWGRLVADALRAQTKSDIALVDAGSLNEGTLAEGGIERADIEALLAFGTRDGVVVLRVTGAQLRAALERAVQDYPTRSTSFLHGSGLTASFTTGGAKRVGVVRVGGKVLADDDEIEVALPSSVAGGAVFGGVWGQAPRREIGGTLASVVADYVRAQGTVAPDAQPRIGAR